MKAKKRTRLGRDIEQAFKELAGYLRGEADAETYEAADDRLTPVRIKVIRRSVAASTDRKSTRLNSSHSDRSRMPSSA